MEKLKSNNKEENILVWLDFDAYSYLNFGIVNALSKLNNFFKWNNFLILKKTYVLFCSDYSNKIKFI